ncbi:alpha-L-rhamnosidase [Microbacterium dauci]|uniref:alpha-L-rhamnosidase n=1 Tax=Microbacterium dauci TaxID=3048008 RepID=A0ABT6ZG16_9MICO|nr:alpha-L-rhamnosidase [Microbacterium sp. LX3-4]MDJ1115094.1 family 78 glycoside hydrolase catalytic domain [Microbacterium sp. LX3-4]
MPEPLPSLDIVDAGNRLLRLDSQYPPGMIGVPSEGLRLSWRQSRPEPQLGYQVRWWNDNVHIDPPVSTDASIGILAPGPALGSGERRLYSVRVATLHGWTGWSDALVVEGMLVPDDLIALPIGGGRPTGGQATLLRHRFELPATARSARLTGTFWGIGEIRLNGQNATDEHLTPGWTPYSKRILVGTWDVTGLLHSGENVIGALVGDGWYRGRLGWDGRQELYGDETAALLQLDVECVDGSLIRVASSPQWRVATGAIQSAGLYDGVTVDLRQEPRGWDSAGFDDSGWQPARGIPVDTSVLEPRVTTGVRTVEEWGAQVVPRQGSALVDTGQNIAGWLRLVVVGSAGDVVTVRHAEVLEPDGALHTASLRSARATDSYVLAHDGETVLEPHLTYHGFQFAEVVGASVLSATVVAISSADRPRAEFVCADDRLNRLHSNVVWSQRGNFVSLPTDCPQRDERLGWTGDAQVFASTACTLFDVESFWLSWMRDVALEQEENGSIPSVVPNILANVGTDEDRTWTSGRAGWGDVATIAPWAVYDSYGSDEILARQLGSMRKWVSHLESRSGGDLLPREFQFGDWLDPDAPADRPSEAKAPADFVANAFFAHSARLLADAEDLVGDATRAVLMRDLAARVAELTWIQWGEEAIDTQTGAALALELHIAPPTERERVGARLAERVREQDGRIATGFLGTPLVLHALATGGYFDEAYEMLLRSEPPSWLYQVEMGATTVWERWDALDTDGHPLTANDGSEGMLSFNHYAYGAVVDWMYRVVAGLAPTRRSPGYRTVIVAPRPCRQIPWARASIETRLGAASVSWTIRDGDLEIDLVIPPGSEAVLDLPVTENSRITLNEAPYSGGLVAAGVHHVTVSSPQVFDAAGGGHRSPRDLTADTRPRP